MSPKHRDPKWDKLEQIDDTLCDFYSFEGLTLKQKTKLKRIIYRLRDWRAEQEEQDA